MSQEIKNIAVKDLVLWTENPRDPINPEASDQDVADNAINADQRKKWSLKKLFEKMGKRFDQSEIPTVAYLNEKPIVYDGNRRVLIGKIIHGHVKLENSPDFLNFEFPEIIPCNVCDKKTALEHVDRKHSDSGSWLPLERDIFKYREMQEEKSPFLILEENTGIISKNPELNKRFVKEEIFDRSTLHRIGFSTNEGKLKHAFQKQEDADAILDKITGLVVEEEISTRKNRDEIEKLLKQDTKINNILKNKEKTHVEYNSEENRPKFKRKTPISKGKAHDLFGKKLVLESGTTNNLYSDLLNLYKNRKKHSNDFPIIIRMGMRLLCENAFKDGNSNGWGKYLIENFESAKSQLNKDEKNTLNNQSVNEEKIVSLLQSGAHDYTNSNNLEQTIAISLIVGKLLETHCGKKS